LKYRSVFPTFRKYFDAGPGAYLEFVVLYRRDDAQDSPGRGWFLFHETIDLLAESGASLDHDIGWATAPANS
jgi:hypothetical protein